MVFNIMYFKNFTQAECSYNPAEEILQDHDKKGTTKSSLCSTFTSSNAVTALISMLLICKYNVNNYLRKY